MDNIDKKTVTDTEMSDADGKNTEKTPKAKPPTFTPEQEEHFKAVIDKEYAKLSAKFDKKEREAAEAAEAAKLAGLSEAERTKAELEAAQKKITEYEQQSLIGQFKIELSGKGLPVEFADNVPIKTADEANKFVKLLAKFKENIEKPLSDKLADAEENLRNATLRGYAPKAPQGTPQDTVPKTMDDWNKLKNADPTLYEQMLGQIQYKK